MTGIALAGASVIAVSPLAPPPVTTSATTTVSSVAVQLSAAVDPLTRWGQVISASADNISELGEYWQRNPMPITRQIISNWQTYGDWVVTGVQGSMPGLQAWATETVPAAFEQAGALLQAGKPQQAVETITAVLSFGGVMFSLLPMMNLLQIPNLMAAHAAALVPQIFNTTMMTGILGGISNVWTNTANSLGATAQTALDAFNAGDVTASLTAIANAPADVVDRVLNSTGGLIDIQFKGSTGSIVVGGPVLSLILKRAEAIAKAIAVPVTVAPSAAAIMEASTAELPAASSPTEFVSSLTKALSAPTAVTVARNTASETDTAAPASPTSTASTDTAVSTDSTAAGEGVATQRSTKTAGSSTTGQSRNAGNPAKKVKSALSGIGKKISGALGKEAKRAPSSKGADGAKVKARHAKSGGAE